MDELVDNIVFEIVNCIYFLKKTQPYSYIKLIEEEIKRRQREEKKCNKMIKQKISEHFDKELTKKLTKLL